MNWQLSDFKIGDIVSVGKDQREMEVYEEYNSNGEKYLALRSITGSIFNGDLRYYIDGCWGGINNKINA